MSRRLLTFMLALAISLVGNQPSFGMTDVAAAPAMEMIMDGDCSKSTPDNCCDKTEKDKRLCLWSDACAARCHVNTGLEAVFLAPIIRSVSASLVTTGEPPPLHAARFGPRFRPPIL
jgi:hypothetical protein